jgi:restriction endonuclease
MLHDGLVVVQDFLGQIDSYNKNPIDSLSKNPMVRNGKQSSTELLQMMNSKLEELEALYQQMHAKSVLHEFRRDERDFLQQLIDRIDHMIHQLENDEPSPQDQELIRKNLDILQSLKDQLSA